MAKVIDITDKLSFDENPRIKIKGKEFEVNADAKTMLEIMGLFSGEGEDSAESLVKAYEKLISEQDRKVIDKMKLPFKDLVVVIQTAMNLVKGDGEEGEA